MKYIAFVFAIFHSLTCIPQHSSSSEIIKHTAHFILGNSTMTQIDTVLLQINNRNADTEILIPYSKGDKVNVNNIWIEDLEGNIILKLKNNDIKDRSYISSISLYEDDFVKYFNVRHDQYPYRIYYTYNIKYAKSLNTIEIDHSNSKITTHSEKLIVETSSSDSIKIKYGNIDRFDVITDKQTKKYIWQYSYTAPSSFELYGNNKDLKAPNIHLVPLTFKYGETGSFESWQSFGNWVYRLNKNKDKLTVEEKDIIDKLLNGVKSDREKAEILYRYLQNHTRYINVSLKLGGLQPYPASYVCINKYGDCKALTNYMYSILKYAGIKSFYTLIQAGENIPDIEADFPSQIFNHAILTVPIDTDTVFLECTDKNIPFGYMGTFTQGRKALLIDEINSQLIQIPELLTENTLCSRKIVVNPNTQNIGLHETLRGYKYEFFNYVSKELSKNQKEEIIRSHIFTGKTELIDYNLLSNNVDSAVINLTANFKAHNIAKKYGKNIILSPFPLINKKIETPSQRKTGIQIDYPEFLCDTIIYEITENEITKSPENISIETEFGKYEVSYHIINNNLLSNKTFLMYAGKYPLELYEKFYRFIETVNNNELKNIYIETF